ncbi:MAG: hypothetical protein QM714_04575 [Nocardioides sp.]|uniref:hypothetical protein n=1 Tax=Nocardioides sp. TaxID=35761 RepID=UPI0039E50DE2
MDIKERVGHGHQEADDGAVAEADHVRAGDACVFAGVTGLWLVPVLAVGIALAFVAALLIDVRS